MSTRRALLGLVTLNLVLCGQAAASEDAPTARPSLFVRGSVGAFFPVYDQSQDPTESVGVLAGIGMTLLSRNTAGVGVDLDITRIKRSFTAEGVRRVYVHTNAYTLGVRGQTFAGEDVQVFGMGGVGLFETTLQYDIAWSGSIFDWSSGRDLHDKDSSLGFYVGGGVRMDFGIYGLSLDYRHLFFDQDFTKIDAGSGGFGGGTLRASVDLNLSRLFAKKQP